MKKMLFFRKSILLPLLLLLLIPVVVGCGTRLDPTLSPQQGYIVEIREERILVISHIDREDIGELSVEELLEKSVDQSDGRDLIAVWYSVDSTEEFEVGQYVEVRSREVMDSWPQQANAEGVQVLESP